MSDNAAPTLLSDDKPAAAPAADLAKPAAAPAADPAKPAAAAPAAVSADDQRAFLVKQGGKADEVGKLSDAELKTKFDAAKTAADAKDVVPADGKYTFTAPQGMQIEPALADEFSGIAKDLKLTQGAADKLAAFGAKLVQNQSKSMLAQLQKAHDGWSEQSRSDKEFGGAELDKNLAVAKRGLKSMDADGELQKLLDATGLGSHPVVIRAFFRHGKTVSEDTLENGRRSDAKPTVRQVTYPNSNHNA